MIKNIKTWWNNRKIIVKIYILVLLFCTPLFLLNALMNLGVKIEYLLYPLMVLNYISLVYKDSNEEVYRLLKWSMLVFGLSVLLFFILPTTEPIREKENPVYSRGDCRIVNIKEAVKVGMDIHLFTYPTKLETHIYAVDKNDIVYDISRSNSKNYKTIEVDGKIKKISEWHNTYSKEFTEKTPAQLAYVLKANGEEMFYVEHSKISVEIFLIKYYKFIFYLKSLI